MGILGLRKFIDSSSCTKLLRVDAHDNEEESSMKVTRVQNTSTISAPQSDEHVVEDLALCSNVSTTARVDHVLVDLNCIIHSCLRNSTTGDEVGASADISTSKRDLIQTVLQRLRFLLTRVVVPTVSLTVCIDGPAPYAKLPTQRLRRRQIGLLDTGGAQQLSSLAITPGSLLLVELENALAAQFKLCDGRGFLSQYVPVFLYGSTVAGEGEAKIARSLAFLAAGGCGRVRGAGGSYNPNDTVAVVGNDIDLTLTCIGATQYHNFFVLGPSSMQLISVSTLLYRWLHSGVVAAEERLSSCGEFCLTARHFASVRVDFVFLFLLNGGDHYAGVGEVAHVLWRRYRTVRGASGMQRSLVSEDLTSVDAEMLADVLQAAEYSGDADVDVGVELLRAALWSLQTTVSGVCPDYHFVPKTSTVVGGPHLNHIRGAANYCCSKRIPISFNPRVDHTSSGGKRRNSSFRTSSVKGVGPEDRWTPSLPLTPLETLVALMPTEASLPASVARGLRSSRKLEHVARTLVSSHDISAVADAARQAVESASAYLTASERYLRDFTEPVQINVPQKAKRVSRHEQHRMLATMGRIVAERPMPVVQRIEMPKTFQYIGVGYPAYVTDLLFFSPFDGPSSGQVAAEEMRGAAQRIGGSKLWRADDSTLVDAQRIVISCDSVAGESRVVRNVRRVSAHPRFGEFIASTSLQPRGKTPKFTVAHGPHASINAGGQGAGRVNGTGQNVCATVEKESRRERRCHLINTKMEKEFVDEIRDFLGCDDFDEKWVIHGGKSTNRKRSEPHPEENGKTGNSIEKPAAEPTEVKEKGKNSKKRKRKRNGAQPTVTAFECSPQRTCSLEDVGVSEGGGSQQGCPPQQPNPSKRRRKR